MLRIVVVVALLCIIFPGPASCVRLSTKSRWVVDEGSGSRVKLTCVNLVSHLEPMVTEGLDRQPLKYIANAIASRGFNCVRLTWATYMVTKPEYGNLTVAASLRSLNLTDAVSRMSVSNPDLLGLPLLEAYKEVVRGLGDANIMVILDNQVSKPQWCCGNDGNAFFGDDYFDPQEWLQGLTIMASTFKDNPAVVGMSLRNELRGPRSNPADWYKYMQAGAKAVHAANPGVIVILSGLSYDTDLKFLASNPISLTFTDKIMYELHWYSFTGGDAWERSDVNVNRLCGSVTARVNDHAAFVVRDGNNNFKAAPLFISEFGIDERGTRVKDNRYVNCFLAFAAEGDFEWALWTLQGSYYLRNGRSDFEETFGILKARWDEIRNPNFLARLKSIQRPFQDPFSAEAGMYQMVYHPASGLCLAASEDGNLKLDSCDSPSSFTYKPSAGALGVSEKSMCISAQGDGMAAVLSTQCTHQNYTWQVVSDSKLQIAVTVPTSSVNGTAGQMQLCLDGKSSPQVLTNQCLCVADSNCAKTEDVQMQWFKVVQSNRKRT
uniref:Glycoside hydrolase family 5 domain-containing protein n=1 Tax=Araucaria cunninghamii TaxID=56994 RepID=A0A0D6QSZ4_ARACU